MKKLKLEAHKSAQCHVKTYPDDIIKLWSYDTMVIEIIETTLKCTGLYSATTRRHILWFLNKYAPNVSYQDVKKAVEKNGGLYQW